MAKRQSVFGDEWRRCLKEHYKYVIKHEDHSTEETLVPILQRFGFREDELRQLYLEATMRADALPDGFVPDFQRVQERSFEVHPAECGCPSCMDTVLEVGHDEEGQPLTEEAKQEEAEKSNPDVPKQKSLF